TARRLRRCGRIVAGGGSAAAVIGWATPRSPRAMGWLYRAATIRRRSSAWIYRRTTRRTRLNPLTARPSHPLTAPTPRTVPTRTTHRRHQTHRPHPPRLTPQPRPTLRRRLTRPTDRLTCSRPG